MPARSHQSPPSDGSQQVIQVPFHFLSTADLLVVKTQDGVNTTLVDTGTDYTAVLPQADGSGFGAIKLTVALKKGAFITVTRTALTAPTQPLTGSAPQSPLIEYYIDYILNRSFGL